MKKKKNLKVIKGKTTCLKIKSLTLNLVFDKNLTESRSFVSQIMIYNLTFLGCLKVGKSKSMEQNGIFVPTTYYVCRVTKAKKNSQDTHG